MPSDNRKPARMKPVVLRYCFWLRQNLTYTQIVPNKRKGLRTNTSPQSRESITSGGKVIRKHATHRARTMENCRTISKIATIVMRVKTGPKHRKLQIEFPKIFMTADSKYA